MKFGDYHCRRCGHIKRDVPVPFGKKYTEVEVVCDRCDREPLEMPVQMDYIWNLGGVDAGNGASFKAFDALDGRGQPVHIGSLKDLRRVERESETFARNGEGQQLCWRDYSQDRGNSLTHTLMQDPSAKIDKKSASWKRLEARRHGEKKPRRGLGPGVKISDIGIGATA